MKPISELGLETIQLEDQVLLVKIGEFPPKWYLDDINQIRKSITDDPDWWSARLGYRSITSSTKPLEGLPLLVIEDEVEKLAWDYTDGNTKSRWAPIVRNAVGYGYKKAKETYKFTEEDLRKAIQLGSDFCDTESFEPVPELVISDFLQSLTKKELWVEVEWDCCGRCDDIEDKCTGMWKLKIEKKVIKAVWK